MHDIQQRLAKAVRDARKEYGVSQEKLAEHLDMDTRTIINIEAGRGNPKLEKLYPIIKYLKIPSDLIFESDKTTLPASVQKLITLLSDCTEQEAENLLPVVYDLLNLLHNIEQK